MWIISYDLNMKTLTCYYGNVLRAWTIMEKNLKLKFYKIFYHL